MATNIYIRDGKFPDDGTLIVPELYIKFNPTRAPEFYTPEVAVCNGLSI